MCYNWPNQKIINELDTKVFTIIQVSFFFNFAKKLKTLIFTKQHLSRLCLIKHFNFITTISLVYLQLKIKNSCKIGIVFDWIKLKSNFFSDSINFVEHKSHVFVRGFGQAVNDHPEEVFESFQRLVSDHQTTLFDHCFFYHWWYEDHPKILKTNISKYVGR